MGSYAAWKARQADERWRGMEQLRDRVMELEAGIREFLDHEDTHEPGPYIKDGNWLGALREKYPDGFLSCADEDCGLYWPCPVEELRRVLLREKPDLPPEGLGDLQAGDEVERDVVLDQTLE